MATLVQNVWIDGRYYGPDHGGDSALPAELVDRVPDDAWFPGPPETEAGEVVGEPEPQRYEVLARAQALGLDVDRRWSTKRLTAALAKAEQEATRVRD